MVNFRGPGLALDADGVHAACDLLGVKAPELWAVLSVETSGCGYLAPSRQPKLLFERHYFHRLTGGRYDAVSDISSPTPGGYGASGMHQYDRLAIAMKCLTDDNRDVAPALASASWGIGQVMGEHAVALGFAGPAALVDAMVASENRQLAAMAGFIKTNKLAGALASHDWTSFARGYNGAGYAANNYDGQLRSNYQKWAAGPLPDLTVRAAQIYLSYLNIDPHGVDGLMGKHTIDALNTYRATKGMPAGGGPDDATFAALQADATA